MKVHNYFIIIICITMLIAGCNARQVRVNSPPQADPNYVPPTPIVEESISSPQVSDDSMMAKSAPQPMPDPVVSEGIANPAAMQAASLSIDHVNDRIYEYGRKLDRWKELDEQSVVMNLTQEQTEQMVRCFRDLQKVLNSYGRLRDDMLQRNVISSSQLYTPADVMELQKQDISFLDSHCGRMLATTDKKAAGWQERQEGADLSQIEALIERYSSNKEYSEVVQVWRKIPAYQVERVDLKTKILFGNALMYLDQQEKAAEIYQQIVDEMSASKEQPTDLLSLRKVLADLYTASGDYLAAEKQYDQISADYLAIGKIEEWSKLQLSILERSSQGSPELTEFSSLLRQFLGFLPERDGYKIVWKADEFLQSYPYSPVSSNVDIIKEAALSQADEWFNGYFERVDGLAEEQKYQDAMELLQTIPTEIIGDEKVKAVSAKTDELVLAEAVARETLKIERMQELQRTWNEGMKLAETKEYDASIELFTGLLGTEYSSKAQTKIEELSLQAARDDRRRAAELFIRFTKTSDPESRKRLLVESRKILKGILTKYPEVEISQKVVGNIQRVEKEMNLLDPTLLPAIIQEEQAAEARSRVETEASTPAGLDAFDLPSSPSEEPTFLPASPEPTPPVPVQPVQQPGPSSTALPVLTPQDLE